MVVFDILQPAALPHDVYDNALRISVLKERSQKKKRVTLLDLALKTHHTCALSRSQVQDSYAGNGRPLTIVIQKGIGQQYSPAIARPTGVPNAGPAGRQPNRRASQGLDRPCP